MRVLSGYDLRQMAIIFRNEELGQTIVVRNSIGEVFMSIDFVKLPDADVFTHSCELDAAVWESLVEIAE